MRLGLDFGTTNSSVAIYDGELLTTIASDPTNMTPELTPSLIYVDRDWQTTVGAGAAFRYLREETGRRPQWEQREVGNLNHIVASTETSYEYEFIRFTENVHTVVDVGERGRLLQSIKTALFNRVYEGTLIFNRFYPVEELVSLVLGKLKDAAERHLDGVCDNVVMGRPVKFGDRSDIDAHAESALRKAAYRAGFREVEFCYEPIGVAHLYHATSNERQIALVFDFGGGTLDLTVVRLGGKQIPEVLASVGVIVGGNDLDRRLMEYMLPFFDADRLPPELSDRLLGWKTMPLLSQPYNLGIIRRLQREAADPRNLEALETLVTEHLGFQLFQEIERVKIALSTHEAADLQFLHIDTRITRRRFERLIRPELRLIQDGVDQVLEASGVSEVDLVIRTGGSSRVPVVHDLLAGQFGADKIKDIDPLTSVVGGLAVIAHRTPSLTWIM